MEVVLHAYVNESFTKNYIFNIYLNNKSQTPVKVTTSIFSNVIGQANAGPVYVDITSAKKSGWQWIDFYNNLELYVEQNGFAGTNTVYYDAIGLRITSVPGTDTSLDALVTPWLPPLPLTPASRSMFTTM